MFFSVGEIGVVKYVLRATRLWRMYTVGVLFLFIMILVWFCEISEHRKTDSCGVTWDACFILYMT